MCIICINYCKIHLESKSVCVCVCRLIIFLVQQVYDMIIYNYKEIHTYITDHNGMYVDYVEGRES